jgi:hypothetical protein
VAYKKSLIQQRQGITASRGYGWTDPTLFRVIYNEQGDRFPDGKPEETILSRVYFALDSEACQVKIGFTYDVKRRLKQLSHERGRKLDLLGELRGGYDLERCLHQRFRPWRREGNEWYSTEIIGEVHSLLAAG